MEVHGWTSSFIFISIIVVCKNGMSGLIEPFTSILFVDPHNKSLGWVGGDCPGEEVKESESDPVMFGSLQLMDMGFPRQEYRSGLPSPSAGNVPDTGVEPRSPAPQAHS